MKYYFSCPHCGNEEAFSRVEEESSGAGCLLPLLFPTAVLFNTGPVGPRVQCTECGYIFAQPPLPRTTTSKLALWSLCLFGAAIFATLMLVVGSDPDLLPDWPVFPRIRQFVLAAPQACLLGVFAVVMFLISVSWKSDRRAHRKLKKRFKTQPTKYGENKIEKPPAPNAPQVR